MTTMATTTKRKIDFSNPKTASEIVNKLIANTPVAYIILDKNRRVHFMNDYFLKLRNLDKGAVLGNFCYNVSNRGIPCSQCAVQGSIETGKRCFITRKDTLPDGSTRYMDDYAIPLMDEKGNFEFILEMMINRTEEMRLRENNSKVFAGLVEALIAMLDKKDRYTSTHSHDVTEISLKLARHIGLDDDKLFELRLASLLHDIGKIRIPDGIINKPSRLDDNEYKQIQAHPRTTLEMLDRLSRFSGIRHIAGHHHERWDGKGYPDRLEGEAIPLGSRILAIADTYDAMTSTRSYRKALSHEVAVEEILKNRGTQFDPFLADQFVEMAQMSYPSRESLITESTAQITRKTMSRPKVERQIAASEKSGTRVVDDSRIRHMLSDDAFARAVFDNSPGYYTIIDHNFNILFTSPNIETATGLTEGRLRSMRCFEINDKRMSCFGVEDGIIKCPVVRAFQTGTEQRGRVVEKFNGETTYCEIFAVPIDLEDDDGVPFRCMMEILIDRTKETTERIAMDNDVKTLLDMLVGLVRDMDAATTKGSADIVKECANFSDYLTRMSAG